MALHGADVAQLRTTATQFAQGASALETSAKALHSLIGNGTQWRGPDAERFRSEWASVSFRTITAAAAALRQASEELRRNADQQEQASEAASGSGTGGGSAAEASAGDATLVAYYQSAETPASTEELFVNIPERADDDGVNDGMRIDEVTGADGTTRYIVYFAGTGDELNRPGERNVGLAGGFADQVLIDRIKEATVGNPDADIMLVGFSQGGMDAQNIAASGQLSNVTNVVTFGSPVTQPDSSSYHSVHIRADGDHVPGYPTYNTDTMFNSSDSIFQASSRDSTPSNAGWDRHNDDGTYRSLGQQFDDSADSKWKDAKDSMAQFYRRPAVAEF